MPIIPRIAVAYFFFISGFIFANWTSRLPAIQRYYELSNSNLGLILLVVAAGALIAMPFTGWFTIRYGSNRITAITACLSCIMVALIPLNPTVGSASIFFFLLGMSAGAMDVAMNGQAVLVERMWGKSIMSSFHALFSVGLALGAGSGALFARDDTDLFIHFGIVTGIGLIGCIWASWYLLPDRPSKEDSIKDNGGTFRLPTKAILPLGIISFCGMTGEASISDWSAIFMSKVAGQTDAFGALTFGAFGVTMTIGRVFGDRLIDFFGKKTILVVDSLLAILGLGLALAFATPYFSLLGFSLVGLGVATIVPIIYSTAGNTPGVTPSVGIAMASTIGYTGFFVGPPVIGFLSDAFGLRIGLTFTMALFIVMLILILKFKFENKKAI